MRLIRMHRNVGVSGSLSVIHTPRYWLRYVLCFCVVGLSAAIDADAQCSVDKVRLLATVRNPGTSVDVFPTTENGAYVFGWRLFPDTLDIGLGYESPAHALLRFSDAGVLEWWQIINSALDVRLVPDPIGGVYVSGTYGSLIGTDTVTIGNRSFIASIGSDGAVRYVRDLSEPRIQGSGAAPIAFAPGPDGHLTYVIPDEAMTGLIVQRIDPQGATVWKEELPAAEAFTHSISVDEEGNAVVAGAYHRYMVFGTDTVRTGVPFEDWQPNYFVAKWNAEGDLLWVVQRPTFAQGPPPHRQILRTVAGQNYLLGVDTRPSAFVAAGDTIDVGPLFVAHIDSSGRVGWTRSFPFGLTVGEYNFDFEADSSGRLIVSVPASAVRGDYFRYSEHDSIYVGSQGQVLMTLDRDDGSVLCVKHILSHAGLGVGVREDGAIMVAGYVGEYIVLVGGDTIRNPDFPRYALFVGELEESPSAVPSTGREQGRMQVAPNPVRDALSLLLPDSQHGSATVDCVSMNGDILFSRTAHIAPDSPLQIDVSDLPSGTYMIRVLQDDAEYVSRFNVVR